MSNAANAQMWLHLDLLKKTSPRDQDGISLFHPEIKPYNIASLKQIYDFSNRIIFKNNKKILTDCMGSFFNKQVYEFIYLLAKGSNTSTDHIVFVYLEIVPSLLR